MIIQLFTCNLKPISDIDECLVDTHHNCSSDAFCNNTHGSFNCTCKPGFTGDGENCTGGVLSGTCVRVGQQKLYLFSFILFPSYNFLLKAMQRQRWMQTSPFLANLLVCQNSSIGTLFPCYARYRVQPGREQVFCECNHFYILWRCMNLQCCRFLFLRTQLKRFRDAIGQVTPITHSLLSLKILDPPN